MSDFFKFHEIAYKVLCDVCQLYRAAYFQYNHLLFESQLIDPIDNNTSKTEAPKDWRAAYLMKRKNAPLFTQMARDPIQRVISIKCERPEPLQKLEVLLVVDVDHKNCALIDATDPPMDHPEMCLQVLK